MNNKLDSSTCGSCRYFWKGTVGGSAPRCVLDGSHVNSDDACSKWAPKRPKKKRRKQQQQKPNLPIWPVQRVRE